MKLVKQEIEALANKIQRDLNLRNVPSTTTKTKIEAHFSKIQTKFDKSVDCRILKKWGFTGNPFLNESKTLDGFNFTGTRRGTRMNFTGFKHAVYYEKTGKTISLDRIQDEIILAQIGGSSVEQIIKAVKKALA